MWYKYFLFMHSDSSECGFECTFSVSALTKKEKPLSPSSKQVEHEHSSASAPVHVCYVCVMSLC